MNFEVFGPYSFKTETIIRGEHVKSLRKELADDPEVCHLLQGPGCYVFCIKSSGAKRYIPWYVGKAERQSVLSEATNAAHLQTYNEILDEYKKGVPALYFLPATTNTGRIKAFNKSGNMPSVDFLEDWLIAQALKSNSELWNVRKTRMLREMWVRGIFNPTPGDLTVPSKSLKECLVL